MEQQKTLEVGNSSIVLTSENDGFTEGCCNGYLYFYDERYRPQGPITDHMIYTFIITNITDVHRSSLWNAGYVTGWIEALLENHPETFRSLLPEEHKSQKRQTEPLFEIAITELEGSFVNMESMRE